MQKYLTFLFCFLSVPLFSQMLLEGYVYESGNRGYLNTAQILIMDSKTDQVLGEAFSDGDGFFSMELEQSDDITVVARKDMFTLNDFKIQNLKDKMFVNIVMDRKPGYKFEVTLAEKKKGADLPTDAIKNARIEVYNNTTREEVLKLIDHPEPAFNVNFQQGNHYTILIRKPGYLSKRMEAFVDVDGCILCFEGVGKVQPGVSDNLTEGNAMGVLLANVELEPIFEGKTLEIENIYYDLGKWDIKWKAKEQLKKVILLMDDNPNLSLELGSHTDSRGKNDYNKDLSEKRAKSAVQYIIRNSTVTEDRVRSRGYGEDLVLNKCIDNVPCTEEEHAVNRRTELKILGIGDIHNYKSLADMKREEQIEADLLSGNTEQVEVREGETLEEAIARTEAEAEAKSTGKLQQAPTPATVELDKEEEKEMSIDTEVLKQQNEAKAAEVRQAAEEQSVAIKEAGKAAEKEMSIDTEVLKQQNEAKAAEARQAEEEGSAKIPQVDITNQYLNGHKIVIHKSDAPVASDHEIFRRHSKLELYQAPDGGIWYMVGGFATREDAQASFKNFMSVTYPDAYVVTFEKGIVR